MSVKLKVNLLDGCVPVNGRIRGGVLYPALAPRRITENAPRGVTYAYCGAGGRFVVCTCDGAYVSADGVSYARLAEPNAEAFVAEDIKDGEPRALLVCGGSAYALEENSHTRIPFPANVRRGIMHCGRLFAVSADGKKIIWSETNGADGFAQGLYGAGSAYPDDAGRGEILGITEFCGRLVIVRRYGLTVFNAYGAPENFSFEITDTDTDAVFENTAAVAGGKLFFCTASGLKAFDGARVTEVFHRCASCLAEPVCACGCGGAYFLSFRGEAPAVMCYDTADNDSYLIDAAADAMCARDGVYVFNADGVFRLRRGDRAGLVNDGVRFGTCGFKTVTGISCPRGADVKIICGERERAYKNARGKINPHMRGESFRFEISCRGELKNATAVAEAYGEI